jgi:hypothetical protein
VRKITFKPQRHREASALGGFPDLYSFGEARRSVSPWEKQLAQHREKKRDFTSHLERARVRYLQLYAIPELNKKEPENYLSGSKLETKESSNKG